MSILEVLGDPCSGYLPGDSPLLPSESARTFLLAYLVYNSQCHVFFFRGRERTLGTRAFPKELVRSTLLYIMLQCSIFSRNQNLQVTPYEHFSDARALSINLFEHLFLVGFNLQVHTRKWRLTLKIKKIQLPHWYSRVETEDKTAVVKSNCC